jgi:hypothetical protein
VFYGRVADRLVNSVARRNVERSKRDVWESAVRGLERKDSLILAGYQIFHNYVRPDEALYYKTPAEMAGMEVEGNNKWLTLIQNASKQAHT